MDMCSDDIGNEKSSRDDQGINGHYDFPDDGVFFFQHATISLLRFPEHYDVSIFLNIFAGTPATTV